MKRNLQKASQSRVFTIEDRAGPSHIPAYQSLGRAAGVTWGQGAITPVRVPDPKQYGKYVTIDKIKGQPSLPTTSLEFRTTRDNSPYLKLTRKGCPIDVQLHIGACKDPSDFDQGWEKIAIFEDCDITNYTTPDLGAFDADQEAVISETIEITAQDYYEVKPLTFAEQAATQVVQAVIDVAICDARTCGACGLPSDGTLRVLAVETGVGASPGMAAEIVTTQDGGQTWREGNVTSLPVNKTPTAVACVGPYFLVISNDDAAYNYALTADILAGTATWTKVAAFTAPSAPNAILSFGRTATWVVGNGGYIYVITDPTVGATAQTSGDVTAQNLMAIHGIDESNMIAGGASNAIVKTTNGGLTWSLVTGPAGQAAVQINAVYMLSANEWFVGYNDGKLYYTIDAGTTWTQKTIPGSLDFIDDIKFSTRSVGYLAGRDSGTSGRILRTINGGQTWYVLPETGGGTLPTTAIIRKLAVTGDEPNIVWAAGTKAAGADGILLKGA